MTPSQEALRFRDQAQSELEQHSQVLEAEGLTFRGPFLDLHRAESDRFTAELRVEFFRSGELVDLFEFFLWKDGKKSTTIEEVGEWFNENIQDVVRRQRGDEV